MDWKTTPIPARLRRLDALGASLYREPIHRRSPQVEANSVAMENAGLHLRVIGDVLRPCLPGHSDLAGYCFLRSAARYA